MADIKYTEDGYPYYEAALGDTPLATAAKSFFNPVGPTKRLPVKDQYKPTTYIMEPDLMEAQTGKLNVPDDVGFDEAGAAYNTVTGDPVQIIRRPNVLPIAKTPDGFTLAMPKTLDLFGNVMGNVGGLAGGKVAANAGEMVLGSGAVRTMTEAPKVAETVGPFYSALERAVDTAKVNKADASQWIGYLKNQPGVKQEEISYVLNNLPEGQISKDQLAAIIKNNKVELKEVVKGNLPGMGDDGIMRLKGISPSATKYHDYQLPGGSNYQEMLLTLPPKTSEAGNAVVDFAKEMNAKYGERWIGKLTPEENTKYDNLINASDTPNAAELQNYKSSHWDEPNILAHVRYNDRDIPDVGKSLHLEEIQSDWHQAGRKSGYKLDPKERERLDKVAASVDDALIKADREDIMGNPDLKVGLDQAVKDKIITKAEADDYLKLTQNEHSNIPDAPFKKNWDELAFKRMLHKAAVEDYDAISWTPGEAQAARYDLSKSIDNIKVEGVTEAPGVHFVDIKPKSGPEINLEVENGIVREGEYKGKPLADIVGKEHAEKILSVKDGNKEFSGEGLKIGGEGMKSFYDKMLVDKANALAKKYGTKVETKEIINPKEYEAWKELNRGQTSEVGDKSLAFNRVHVLKLTPELKAKAKQGFPLFSSTPILNPVDFDPFQSDKKYRLTPVEGNPFK